MNSAYKEALLRPIRTWSEGCVSTNRESKQAARALILGYHYCLSPETLFNWAERHAIDLWKIYEPNTSPTGPLFIAVSRNITLEEARKDPKLKDRTDELMGEANVGS